jgi:hypothetical protein
MYENIENIICSPHYYVQPTKLLSKTERQIKGKKTLTWSTFHCGTNETTSEAGAYIARVISGIISFPTMIHRSTITQSA